MENENIYWIPFDLMEQFMVDVFKGVGVPPEDAKICADVLITADKRGIDSHGIGRAKTNLLRPYQSRDSGTGD
jgi:L-2-hydroxycarboxylate dehydrogenase (NAD+)